MKYLPTYVYLNYVSITNKETQTFKISVMVIQIIDQVYE